MMGMRKLDPMPFIVYPPLSVTSSTRYGNISIKVTILHFFMKGPLLAKHSLIVFRCICKTHLDH